MRPTLIHAHIGVNAFVGALIARSVHAPLVTTVQGSDINYGIDRSVGNRFRRWATLFGLRSSAAIVGVSPSICRKVVETGIPNSRVTQIPNGFDVSKFYPMSRADSRQKLGLPLDKKIVLYVGNLVPVKGVDILIDAFDRIRSVDDGPVLYCVGDGSEAPLLKSRIKERNLEKNVFLLGRRPHDEIPLWMNACDLFVLASRNEGWPTVLSEVLACGKPVVGTNVGSIPDIMRHEFLGEVVPTEDPVALSNGIQRVLNYPDDSAKIRSYASQYTWDHISSSILKTYEATLRSK